MSPSLVELSPRTLRSVGLVSLTVAVFVAAAVYLLLSVFDGYWLTGTYGWAVLPALACTFILIPVSLRTFWTHVIRGSPVIGYREGRFHYMREGQMSVASDAIRDVDIKTHGLLTYVRFVGDDGQEVAKYPLLLSSIDGRTVVDRAKRIIGNVPGR
jgi:hypothetical protein